MATYEVFKHPILGLEVVKRGFSWPAFFFTWIWALIKRLWVAGIILLLVAIVSGIASSAWMQADARVNVVFGLGILLVLVLGPNVVAGAFGNTWRRASMRSRGYDLQEAVEAGSADGALARVAGTSGKPK